MGEKGSSTCFPTEVVLEGEHYTLMPVHWKCSKCRQCVLLSVCLCGFWLLFLSSDLVYGYFSYQRLPINFKLLIHKTDSRQMKVCRTCFLTYNNIITKLAKPCNIIVVKRIINSTCTLRTIMDFQGYVVRGKEQILGLFRNDWDSSRI